MTVRVSGGSVILILHFDCDFCLFHIQILQRQTSNDEMLQCCSVLFFVQYTVNLCFERVNSSSSRIIYKECFTGNRGNNLKVKSYYR